MKNKLTELLNDADLLFNQGFIPEEKRNKMKASFLINNNVVCMDEEPSVFFEKLVAEIKEVKELHKKEVEKAMAVGAKKFAEELLKELKNCTLYSTRTDDFYLVGLPLIERLVKEFEV